MADVEQGWVLFDLKSCRFGLPIRDLLQMVVLKDVVKVAGAPPAVRGVVNLRGAVFPVIDLRMRLGIPGACEEWEAVFDLMTKRKQDHVRWLTELEASVEERREFKMTRDPHQCAFGKWYDNFKTDNNLLSLHLEEFDAPHKHIHAIADKVTRLMETGNTAGAKALIETTRGKELAKMISLFDDTRDVVCNSINEIVMVMQRPKGKIGVIVDSVTAVKNIAPETIENPLEGHGIASDCIKGIAHLDGESMVLLDERSLFGSF